MIPRFSHYHFQIFLSLLSLPNDSHFPFVRHDFQISLLLPSLSGVSHPPPTPLPPFLVVDNPDRAPFLPLVVLPASRLLHPPQRVWSGSF
ncbi:hypothetical protein V6Z11_D07G170600 [Gossypium hirsutum]